MANDWKARLQALINEHNFKHGVRAKIVADRTKEERAKVLFLCFNELRSLHFLIENPRNFGEKHLLALVASWREKKLSAATLQSRLSILRVFTSWIGKDGLVRGHEHYFPDQQARRTYKAKVDKSWTSVGIEIEVKIAEISAYDHHVGMQLKLIHAFGLRRKEAVMIKPNRADKGVYLAVGDGTKGGRDRVVQIDTDYKRAVLDEAKLMAGTPDGRISDSSLSLPAALDRYSNVVRKFGLTKNELGVTGHGLRAQYACDRYEALTVKPPPVRGGDGNDDELARLNVAEDLGHSRSRVTSAYYG